MLVGFPGLPGAVNSGGGGAGGRNIPPSPQPAGGAFGGDGGPGVVIVKELQGLATSSSLTLISDTFTASSTPTTARIVVFAEITDDLNTDISASATRDNTTFGMQYLLLMKVMWLVQVVLRYILVVHINWYCWSSSTTEMENSRF